MDNSQILEEIDIIVRAKIDKAKKDIDKVKNEVEKMAKTLTKEFDPKNYKNLKMIWKVLEKK